MKQGWMIILLGLTLFMLSGCLQQADEEEEQDVIVVEETEDEESEVVFTPTVDSDDNFYRTVLEDGTYYRSDARGVVSDAFRNRVDLDHFERGLTELASGVYSTDEYYFTEGQQLSGDLINSWIRRYDPEIENELQRGLNPELAGSDDDPMDERMRDAPLMISHIMEHNYWRGSEEEGAQLDGIMIGIGLRAVYYFNTTNEDGTINFYEESLDESEVQEYGREQAQVILNRLRSREDLQDVPISFALYQEKPDGAVAPGGFTAFAQVDGGSLQIGGWEDIDENFIVFPSSEASSYDANLSNQMSQFREEVEDFFDRKIGAVGVGRYNNDILEELTIELNLQSHGQAEIIALSQFISDRLNEVLTVQVPIKVYVESINGMEAIIIQHPDEEPFMHVLN
ncbi:CamS family sex pheromone protein [Salisediminibacterium beveridgei]|uniref:Putative pheromone lipoprotein CamS n=1 Tax=Salisediminibacterium beveridgei TaxID=632773 RepID=A0A1D7QY39_9BACI|nr:CamS family sex pheromone protein [Salisediminibacterium beveridgei]AOM83922.1 Putative pheromone precursor lipoprotein CamS [Salisediminibacterium beveridgei]